jgi:transcription-repair coupling factor (superfamily II helicase)
MKSGEDIDVTHTGKNGRLWFPGTYFVYEPGQLAVSGILDIYSSGNEKPYRVELSK